MLITLGSETSKTRLSAAHLSDDLLDPFEPLQAAGVLGKPHERGERQVLSDGQLLVVRNGQLENVADLLRVPVLDRSHFQSVDEYATLGSRIGTETLVLIHTVKGHCRNSLFAVWSPRF